MQVTQGGVSMTGGVMSFDKIGANFLELARALRDMLDKDPEQFAKVRDTSTLGRRKIYYLIEIDKAFRKLPLSKSRVEKIGWTKAHILAKHINATNAKQMLEMAETNSAHDLKILLAGGKPSNHHTVLNYFTPKQYEVYERALLKHGAQRNRQGGLTNKEQALIDLLKKLT
jgi:hypothetical protein